MFPRASTAAAALALALAAGCNGPPADTDTDAAIGALVLDPCDPSAFDFGALAPGAVASTTVRARNAGGAPLDLISAAIDPPFATTGGPATIGPGSSTQFAVRLIPTAYGSWTADLRVTWSSGGADPVETACAFTGRVLSDNDHDGFDGLAAGGDDCDDTDPTVHPGAPDTWYDGVDSDCDGRSTTIKTETATTRRRSMPTRPPAETARTRTPASIRALPTRGTTASTPTATAPTTSIATRTAGRARRSVAATATTSTPQCFPTRSRRSTASTTIATATSTRT